MDNKLVFESLKKLTLEEFFNLINKYSSNNNKNQEQQKINDIEINKSKVLLNIDELIDCYPFFTRYSINKAIQNDGMPYLVIGNKRLFNQEEIDKWLSRDNNKKEQNKAKYKI